MQIKTWTMLTLAALLAGQAQAGDTLRVATDGTFPPYSVVAPDGKLSGFDVDIANALCAEMKAKCELMRYDFDGMIPALNARKFDLIVASMAITPEREKAVAFSAKYEGGYSQFLGKKGIQLAGTPAGMKGKTLGVQQGTIQEKYAKDVFGKAGAKVRSYSTPANALLDLNAGRADAIMVEIGVGTEFLKGPGGNKLTLFGPQFNDVKYFGTGSGIAMRKTDQALLHKVNSALATILKNGTYKKINDRYFDYNQYD
ncbi:transporter substrate-binding domain-containing protein [Craterilacuibacter sp.]|uniref:transporter substrate-binding domain-containing protein n=1 Tax=Craterilacuibacter sp. TaxID=2870909 RepID=UPI003F3F10DC